MNLVYTIGGKTAATAATIDHAIAQLWNGTNRRIRIREVHVFKVGAGAADEPVIRRSTARGTPGSTLTPTIVNHHGRDIAPPSGMLLDLAAFSAQPTLEALGMYGMVTPAAASAGVMWVWNEPIEVPEGNGLVITCGIALAFPIARVSFNEEE